MEKKIYKVAITGASSGIGYAIAKRLAKGNYQLLLIARRQDKLDDIVSELGDCAAARQLDVTDYTSVEEALKGENIDILINNAGVALGTSKFYQSELDDINQMINTNIIGVVNLCRCVLPQMIIKNYGYIINIGSVLGTYPFPYAHVYGATKSFIEQFSLNLRADLLGTNVRVTVISPGSVRTKSHENRSVSSELVKKAYQGVKQLEVEDISDVVHYCLELPVHVNINKIEIAPVQQNLWASFD